MSIWKKKKKGSGGWWRKSSAAYALLILSACSGSTWGQGLALFFVCIAPSMPHLQLHYNLTRCITTSLKLCVCCSWYWTTVISSRGQWLFLSHWDRKATSRDVSYWGRSEQWQCYRLSIWWMNFSGAHLHLERPLLGNTSVAFILSLSLTLKPTIIPLNALRKAPLQSRLHNLS